MSDQVVDQSIFRAYDIRGKFPTQLDERTAGLVGQALATTALVRGITKIAVARDGRDSSPALASALIEGINTEGIDTLDMGMLPTPIAYWGAQAKANGSSAVITGSHNPREYNGIKMTLNGTPLAGQEIQELRTVIENGRMSNKGVAGVKEHDDTVAKEYAETVLSSHSLQRKVKVVIDCGNGVTGPFYPGILASLGCDIQTLLSEVDGSFPNHHPDPANPANYGEMAAMLDDGVAEIGLAFDGDGDRLGVWLPGDGMVFPDRILMLLAQKLLGKESAKVIYDVKCSVNVAPFITDHGGTPVLCRTGHSFVKRLMASEGARLGGELSGHFFFNETGWNFDDALLAAVRLLEMVSESKSARQLCETVPDSYATPEYTVAMPNESSPHDFVESLEPGTGLPGSPEIVTVDGIRAVWEDAFGLVRASNTTPSLILRFEGKDQGACEKAREAFRQLLLDKDRSLQLPF